MAADPSVPVSPYVTIIEKIETMETAMTVEGLATLISMSPKTLYKAANKKGAGRLPHYRIGGSIRLDPAQIVQWLRDRNTLEAKASEFSP